MMGYKATVFSIQGLISVSQAQQTIMKTSLESGLQRELSYREQFCVIAYIAFKILRAYFFVGINFIPMTAIAHILLIVAVPGTTLWVPLWSYPMSALVGLLMIIVIESSFVKGYALGEQELKDLTERNPL